MRISERIFPEGKSGTWGGGGMDGAMLFHPRPVCPRTKSLGRGVPGMMRPCDKTSETFFLRNGHNGGDRKDEGGGQSCIKDPRGLETEEGQRGT